VGVRLAGADASRASHPGRGDRGLAHEPVIARNVEGKEGGAQAIPFGLIGLERSLLDFEATSARAAKKAASASD
jgi:hypothetical protein